MGYYFAMHKNDLNDFFLSIESKNGLIDVAIGVTIKTFSCQLVKEYDNIVILEIDQNIDKETSSRILILIPRNYPINDKIKVHLVNYMDEAYIESDYNDYRKDKVKHKYYFALDWGDRCKLVKSNQILLMNWNIPLIRYYDVKNEGTIVDQKYYMFSILIDPENFHESKDVYNAYVRQIYYYENHNIFCRIRFFENIDDIMTYFTYFTSKNIKPGNIKIDSGITIGNKPLKSEYPYIEEHWMDNYIKERPEYSPIDTYMKYNENDVKFACEMFKENKMTIKDIKINGPATIIFWADNTKTIVKCQAGEQNDPEKGIIMALVKGIFQKYKGTNNWTESFNIPYSDEIDVEKVIGLALLRDHYGHVLKDPEWHYNYVLKWVYKNKGYKIEDEIAALKALGYSDERIKKCLKTNLGVIRNALGQDMVYKKEQKIRAELKSKSEKKFINSIRFPSGDEYSFVVNKEETKKVLKDIIKEDSLSDKVVKMFNDGEKIAKIAKTLGISEYFVKKALDEVTKPKANPKKIDRILKNAKKEKIIHKKHVKHTEILFPNYLEKEEAEKILAATKLKYANVPKINCLSELQKYFDRECRIYKIKQLYGKNGYSMYEIAKIIGVSVNSVQSLYTRHKEEINND